MLCKAWCLYRNSRVDALHTFHVNLFDKNLNRKGPGTFLRRKRVKKSAFCTCQAQLNRIAIVRSDLTFLNGNIVISASNGVHYPV